MSPRTRIAAREQAVVLTGASSGIGRACCERLLGEGYRVFAGFRKPADGEALARAGAQPLRIDVTDQASVQQAADAVGAELAGRPLAGLVNNAGISVIGPLELLPLDDLRRQLEVNVVGQVAVTQAFLPALVRARGRIVNMGSLGGRLALPLVAPYAASKYALEAVTDALRRELRGTGVRVSIIEPGTIATPIWQHTLAAADALIARGGSRYGSLLAAFRAEAERMSEHGLPPAKVAAVVVRALSARRPRTRYLVGSDAKLRVRSAAVLPDRAMDWIIARALAG